MSIDGRIAGVRIVSGEHKLLLEERHRLAGGPGQETLIVLNPPADGAELECLIGCEVWGGNSEIVLGDRRLARRHGYTGIELVDSWKQMVEAYTPPHRSVS